MCFIIEKKSEFLDDINSCCRRNGALLLQEKGEKFGGFSKKHKQATENTSVQTWNPCS